MVSRPLIAVAVAGVIGAGVAYLYFRRRGRTYEAPKGKPPVQGAIPILSTKAYTFHGEQPDGTKSNKYYVFSEWNPVFMPPSIYQKLGGMNIYTTRWGAIGDDHERYNDANLRRKYTQALMLGLIYDATQWPEQFGKLPDKWKGAGGTGVPGQYMGYTVPMLAGDAVRKIEGEGYKLTTIDRAGIWFNPDSTYSNMALVDDDNNTYSLYATIAEPLGNNIKKNLKISSGSAGDIVSLPSEDIKEGWAAQDPAPIADFADIHVGDIIAVQGGVLGYTHGVIRRLHPSSKKMWAFWEHDLKKAIERDKNEREHNDQEGYIEFKPQYTDYKYYKISKGMTGEDISEGWMSPIAFAAPASPDKQSFTSIQGVNVPRYRCSKCKMAMKSADNFLTCDIHGGVEPLDLNEMSDTDRFEAMDEEVFRLLVASPKSVIRAEDVGMSASQWALWIYGPAEPANVRNKEYFAEHYNKMLVE